MLQGQEGKIRVCQMEHGGCHLWACCLSNHRHQEKYSDLYAVKMKVFYWGAYSLKLDMWLSPCVIKQAFVIVLALPWQKITFLLIIVAPAGPLRGL